MLQKRLSHRSAHSSSLSHRSEPRLFVAQRFQSDSANDAFKNWKEFAATWCVKARWYFTQNSGRVESAMGMFRQLRMW
jgi:hypothetical protein